MKIREIDIPDNRPFIVRAASLKPSNDFNPPNTLGKPRGKDNAEAKKVMAMDTCIKNVLSGFRNELANCGTPMFVGYGLLSSISQEALIRAGVETIADEMTRKFVKFRYDVDDGREDHEQEISDLEEEAAKYKLKDIFNDAAQKDGYFGGCLVYIDVGDLDDEEALEPLVLDKKTFKKGMLKGFKVIEPINIYPAEYNTTDPTDKNYFNPEYWYILGKRYHASRFLYFVGNSVPILLKPAYNFFGIARAQLALDYIAHFVENRESAQELLNKFSLTCWKTDMSQVLAGESCNDLVKRVRMFNKMKSNNGTLVVDKEQEDIMQINTPLAGVRDIVDMSLSLLTAVWRIPKIKYIGEGEGGLNASSKEQMRSFYDFILSQKEKMFTEPMEKVLKILQLNMGKDINESIGFEFPSLVEMDDSEIAQLNKMKADTAVQLINAGVVSQEEVRQNLSMDKHSGFSMIDVDDMPEQQEQPNEKEVVEVEDRDLITDEFVESEHPRDDYGKFTKSSSEKNALVMTEKQWEEYSDKKGEEKYPVSIGKTLSIIKNGKYGNKELHTDGEFYGRNLRSALSKFIKNSPKEVSQWSYLLEDNSDKELEEFLYNEKIDTDEDYIRGEHIRDEEDGKSLYYFWTKNSTDGTVGDEDLTMDDRWITIGHKDADEDGEEHKGRHILLKNGEDPIDALERTTGKDIDKDGKVGKKDDSSEKSKEVDNKPETSSASEKKPETSETKETEKKPDEEKEDKNDLSKLSDEELKKKSEDARKKSKELRDKEDEYVEKNEKIKNLEKEIRELNVKGWSAHGDELKEILTEKNSKIDLRNGIEYDLRREFQKENGYWVDIGGKAAQYDIELKKRNNERMKNIDAKIDNLADSINENNVNEKLDDVLNVKKEINTFGIFDKIQKNKEFSEKVDKKVTNLMAEKIGGTVKDYGKKTDKFVNDIASIDDEYNKAAEKNKEISAKVDEAYERYSKENDVDKRQKLRQEWQELLPQRYAALDATVEARKKRIERVATKIRESFGDTGNKIETNAGKKGSFSHGVYQKLQSVLDGVIGKEISTKNPPRVVAGVNRAFFSESKGIKLNKESSVGTMIHEFCHFLEKNNPKMLANSKAFLEYRTKGEQTQKLNKITGNSFYGNSEVTKKDKFFSPYCGKVYSVNNEYYGADATELMSMGVQKLFEDPFGFAKEDREYFDFVIGNLRGEI